MPDATVSYRTARSLARATEEAAATVERLGPVGGPSEEGLLLPVSAQLEAALTGADRRPSL